MRNCAKQINSPPTPRHPDQKPLRSKPFVVVCTGPAKGTYSANAQMCVFKLRCVCCAAFGGNMELRVEQHLGSHVTEIKQSANHLPHVHQGEFKGKRVHIA